jgi:hypothetical protein
MESDIQASGAHDDMTEYDTPALPYWRLFLDSVTLGFHNGDVGLAYLGGFVARASSVSISSFHSPTSTPTLYHLVYAKATPPTAQKR